VLVAQAGGNHTREDIRLIDEVLVAQAGGNHTREDIRLIDATAREVAAMADRLGPHRRTAAPPQPLTNQVPDIIIRLKERLVVPGLKYIGLNSASLTNEGFYVLDWRSSGRGPHSLEQIGDPREIVCQSSLTSVLTL